jgi:hypothetical protein
MIPFAISRQTSMLQWAAQSAIGYTSSESGWTRDIHGPGEYTPARVRPG